MSDKLATLNKDLDKITDEIEAIQEKWKGKRMGDSEAGRADAKRRDELAHEGKQLQDEIESEMKAQHALSGARRLRELPDPDLPAPSERRWP